MEGKRIPMTREFGHTFVHDDAPIHCSHYVQRVIDEYDIDWPQYSPDLNPIESVWKYIKNKLTLISKGKLDFTNIEETVKKIYAFIEKLYKGMQK